MPRARGFLYNQTTRDTVDWSRKSDSLNRTEYMMSKRWGVTLCLAFAAALSPAAQAGEGDGKYVMVDVKRRTRDKSWTPRKTVTLGHVAGFRPRVPGVKLSQYGGRTDRKVRATGFFHVRRVGGRWWLVDPEGCLWYTIGCCSVRRSPTRRGEAALKRKFGTSKRWAAATGEQLRENGFNTLGCWSAWEEFRQVRPRVPYTTQLNFMSGYGKKRGGTYQKPGHTGYPNDCIFVFDPEFEAFCERHARKLLSATRDDPYLVGHFTDNEMPFRSDALDRYMRLAKSDPGHQAAAKWVRGRNVSKGAKGYAQKDRDAFLEHVSATYFRIVSRAIRKADPNHMVLGSRFHGGDLRRRAVFAGCAKYVDVVSINCYGVWTPDAERMTDWVRWSGRPFVITEWYAKGMDSGMTNITGAGWTVKTQADRAAFYQNFAIGLLRSPACVGWHWHRYMDNDPADKLADPSNIDSNKGIVSNRYRLYTTLTDGMRELNRQVYPLREFLLGGQ